jgi:hypothetical protein
MSFRSTAALVVVWTLSMIAAAKIATAQAPEMVPSAIPIVVSGNDLGFRIDGQRGQTPVGRIVVRIDGQWVEAELSRVGKPLIAVPLSEQPATPLLRRRP